MSTIAQCAKHLKMNERTFKVLLDSGVFKRATRNNYDLDVVRETYIEHLRAAAEGRSDGSANLTDARTRVALAKAESAERQNQQDAGEWVRVKEVVAYLLAEILRMREHFLSMPGKMCGPLANVDSIDAYRVVKDEVWESLDRFADGKAAVNFIIEAIHQCAGKVSDPEAQALLKIIPILYAELDAARAARGMNKTEEGEEWQAEKKRKAEDARQAEEARSRRIASCICAPSTWSTCPRPDCPKKEWVNAHR
jgi:hypothetical protein